MFIAAVGYSALVWALSHRSATATALWICGAALVCLFLFYNMGRFVRTQRGLSRFSPLVILWKLLSYAAIGPGIWFLCAWGVAATPTGDHPLSIWDTIPPDLVSTYFTGLIVSIGVYLTHVYVERISHVRQTQVLLALVLLSSILRLGPLRSLDLAHLHIDILPHLAGIGLTAPAGVKPFRRNGRRGGQTAQNPPPPRTQCFFLLSIVRRKRNDSVPVSMICARSVIRSNNALHNRGFGNTVVHSENGRFVVTMIAARSARSEITWNRNSAPISASGT